MQPANVRRTPGYRNKPEGDIVAGIRIGDSAVVIDGPTEQDGLTWVKLDRGGWVATAMPTAIGESEAILAPSAGFLPFRIASPVSPLAVVTQEFGENPAFYSQIAGYPVPLKGHNGRDYGQGEGAPILACDDGLVEKSGLDSFGFGIMVKVRHAWGESIYAHLVATHVVVGQTVARGHLLGGMGNTGLSQGVHLHFGIRVNPYDRADGWGGFSDPRDHLES